MNIFQIAVNNLKRRKMKMLFLMLGLVVGVATVVAMLSIVEAMRLELGDRIDEFGANAVIMPRSEGVELDYGGTMVSGVTFDMETLTEDDIPKIYESSVVDYVNIVSPKLVGAVQAEGQNGLIVGVDTKREFTQKPWFSLQSQDGVGRGESVGELALLDVPEDGIILGSSAARVLDKNAGDRLEVNEETFTVFGVLAPMGTEEDGLIYANLPVVQGLLERPGELTMIEVSAYCNFCPIEEVVIGLSDALPNANVIALRQAAQFRYQTIDQFTAFGYALSGVVLLIAALVVLTTMLSSVNERTREIGIFRAIGFRRAHVMEIVYLEAGMVSILGGLAGYLLGSAAASVAGPFLAQIQGSVPLRYDLILPAILLSAVLALLASTYPALKAAKLDPAEALRFI
ncbi:ABC transporter permease [Dethiobacter alkaliphilus]|uniref:ABC transporter permease n=1 Tax=Dethiobacter alkaliphilus TaxID=427926 RepID=UPI0022270158|nr:FtsX-like permease family protein [Dethiobacter alkaliphilus]MCW3491396.1 ABC transporter permease [Dethiobacter alkaliphilus]